MITEGIEPKDFVLQSPGNRIERPVTIKLWQRTDFPEIECLPCVLRKRNGLRRSEEPEVIAYEPLAQRGGVDGKTNEQDERQYQERREGSRPGMRASLVDGTGFCRPLADKADIVFQEPPPTPRLP